VLIIIPLQGETTILGGIPIFSDLVMLVMEGREEVHDIILIGVADSKVVHNQSETDVVGVMLPQARVKGYGWQPWGSRNCWSWSFAILPACGRPYMPHWIST